MGLLLQKSREHYSRNSDSLLNALPMETSGLDPEITICKIAVLPIKLYPLINLLKLGVFKTSLFLIYYTLVLIN
jgi:hypothetical protein